MGEFFHPSVGDTRLRGGYLSIQRRLGHNRVGFSCLRLGFGDSRRIGEFFQSSHCPIRVLEKLGYEVFIRVPEKLGYVFACRPG